MTHDLATQVRALRPRFVTRAARGFTGGERVLASFEAEVGQFYTALADTIESGSLEWVFSQLRAWIQAAPKLAKDEYPTFLPLLEALRVAVYELLSDTLPAPEAVEALLTVERYFSGATRYLAELEAERRVRDIEMELQTVRARLERIDRSKSDFIAVAAHELRTPLTLIEGYSKLVESEIPLGEYPQVQTMLSGLETGVRRMEAIIIAMVDVSLIDNHMLTLAYQPVWVGHLVKQACRALEPILTERRQVLRFENIETETGMTFADTERLYQAVKNILENAIKYTPDGGQIVVQARLLPGFFEIAITDSGIGIAPEDVEHIFEKFGRVGEVALHSSSRTRFKGGGPGLGLTIAKGIIEAHGGTIWVESPGYDEKTLPGSTFHIMIPELRHPPADKTSKLFSALTPERAALFAGGAA